MSLCQPSAAQSDSNEVYLIGTCVLSNMTLFSFTVGGQPYKMTFDKLPQL
jgi:hypothetical protein